MSLKEGFGDVYKHASEGAVATVADRKVDSYGHELIWVRWDRSDHAESEGWTYPAHFKVVEHDNHTIAQFTDKAEIRRLEDERTKVKRAEEYLDFLIKAVELAEDGQGFLMITIQEDEEDGDLVPFGFAMAKTEDAGIFLEAQIVQMAAEVHLHTASRAIQHLNKDDDE